MKLDPTLETSDLQNLLPQFSSELLRLQETLATEGISLRYAAALRGPLAQAKMWCRSRSFQEVERRREILRSAGAIKLAEMLKIEYAGLGPPLTDSLPGQSWHQYGEAVDVYFLVGGVTIWEGTPARRCARLASEVGLHHSYGMLPRRRHWHMQVRKEESPLLVRGYMNSWFDVEEEMNRVYEI